MSMSRALAMLGAGLGGYQKGADEAARRQREEEDRAWQREQRERQRNEWKMSDEERAQQRADKEAERRAAAPVEATPELTPDMQGPQSFNVAGRTIADPAQVDAALAQQNAPAARMRRAAGVTSDLTRAAQLEGSAMQADAARMQMDAAKEAEAVRRFDADLVKSLTAGGWDGFAKFLSESKGDGMGGGAKFKVKKEGGNVTLYPVGPDGTALDGGMTVPDTQEGKERVAFLFSKMTKPADKVRHFADEAKAKVDREDKAADNARADKEAEARRLHEQRMLTTAERAAAAAEGRAAGGAPEAPPVWDDKADTFLRQRFTAADPTTGVVSVDGQGLQFGKALALSVSKRNGGDTTQAIGYAFDVDNRLRAAATDAKGNYDAAKHRALRSDALAAMSKPREEVQPAGDGKMAAIKADMEKTGVQSANFDSGVVKGAIGAPSPKPQAPAPAPPRMQSALTGDAVLNRVMAESAGEQQKRMQALAPAVEQLQTLKAQLAAVANSGDQRAIALAGQKVMQARDAIAKAAKATLGPDADAFIAKL